MRKAGRIMGFASLGLIGIGIGLACLDNFGAAGYDWGNDARMLYVIPNGLVLAVFALVFWLSKMNYKAGIFAVFAGVLGALLWLVNIIYGFTYSHLPWTSDNILTFIIATLFLGAGLVLALSGFLLAWQKPGSYELNQ